jgi:hypothetical protein
VIQGFFILSVVELFRLYETLNPLGYVLTIGLSKILMYDKICKNYIHEKESVKYEDLRYFAGSL